MTILLVGDKPSKYNTSPDIAFVGTKSHTTLLQWCQKMGLKPIFANRTDKDIRQTLLAATIFSTPVVALGNNAANFLSQINTKYFKLPHPSGLNRKLNDKQWLNEQLLMCREWALECSSRERKNA